MVLTDLQTVFDSLNMVTMTSPRRADPTHVLVYFVSHDSCSQTSFGGISGNLKTNRALEEEGDGHQAASSGQPG
jgi:hypothetical protein